MGNAILTQLEILVKPEKEPLALEDAISWVKSSSAEDEKMRLLLTMSRELLENKLGIAFLTQQRRATFEFSLVGPGLVGADWPYEEMLCTLPRPPLQSIDVAAVETDINVFTPVTDDVYDTINQFPTQIYFYGDAFGMVEFPWWFNLNREPRVQVTYTCGYASSEDIPADYKLLLLQMIASQYLQLEGGGVSPELSSTLLGYKVLEL